mmetsp:Transcript_18899/g.18049  ORF Transcript_18899/g.18049 Transcript_18899/m.18049 type:complete len:156 (-) Transcript_18899:106-573(-)|eukprot:CAMPEP_0170555240 /NCGR_PEP_ID=MMETSP0211-20121228/13146_1 /TAXON_ID=311385 /ORGANISM="Pseudokeronopsis sp., Strain OXSARD2" /LENGTH=155 /DNA_ID=CAMNT_0010864947 /DNA_START=416 /DNA_END=883 /DNA_ORIENTATION=-
MLEKEMEEKRLFMFKDILHPKIPNCIFMSQIIADSGTAWQMQAMWIAFLLKGQLALTREDLSLQGMENDRAKRMNHSVALFPNEKDPSIFRACLEVPYFDDLALDMGYDFRATIWNSVFNIRNHENLERYRKIFNVTVEEAVKARNQKKFMIELN